MTLRICVVGCGNIAQQYHGPSLQKYVSMRPDVELSACCDLDVAKARTFQEKYGVLRLYSDIDEMLDRETPDGVFLFLREHLLCPMGIKVLLRGIPLFLEKPPGQNTQELDRLIEAAGHRNTPVQVGFNRRYMPIINYLKQKLDGFPAGMIQHIQYDFVRFGRYDKDFSWTAIHGIDTVRYLAGCDYKLVRFSYRLFPELGPTIANVYMDCELGNGATAHLNFSPVAGVTVERIAIHLLDHTFFLKLPVWNAYDFPGELEHIQHGKLIEKIRGCDISPRGESFVLQGFYDEDADFLDRIQNGIDPVVTLRNAHQSLEIADAIRLRQITYHIEQQSPVP